MKCLAFWISEEYRIGLQDLYIKVLSKFFLIQLTVKDNQTNGIIKPNSTEGKCQSFCMETSVGSKILFIPKLWMLVWNIKLYSC